MLADTLPWYFPGKVTEHILIPLLAGSQNHDLQIQLAHLIHHIGNQVKALLIRQAGHNADHELSVVLFKAQFSLERRLFLIFSFRKFLAL